MKLHRRAILTTALMCAMALPFTTASANMSNAVSPLMPTKDIPAHKRPAMQRYILLHRTPAAQYNNAMMVPLMPTKDHPAHYESLMQTFPWAKQYPAFLPLNKSFIETAAPLMPTKDLKAHQEKMQDYLG